MIRRVLTILGLAMICALATRTTEPEANAACQDPFVRVTQHWWPNSCGPNPQPGAICNNVVTLVGRERS